MAEYLQKLSQQYKSQMDGIRSVHNRTLVRLTSHVETTSQNSTNLAKQIQVLSLRLEKELEKLQRQNFWINKRFDRLQIALENHDSKNLTETLEAQYSNALGIV